MSWLTASLLSAFFAGLTPILAKIGVAGVNSNLATAIRTVFILLFAWSIVLWQGKFNELGNLSSKTWLFLFLSAVATAASWLFYFYALKIGAASKVGPIDKLSLVFTVVLAGLILGESLTLKVIGGTILMAAGAILIAL
ncbi:MAG: EamA family transporter [Candidatus Kerfeldbacteria bacterium]|nr:EamA family transporter [Candidatus Kerfeldbacteria bacterium]